MRSMRAISIIVNMLYYLQLGDKILTEQKNASLGKLIIIFVVIFSLYILAIAFDDESLKIHPFTQSTAHPA